MARVPTTPTEITARMEALDASGRWSLAGAILDRLDDLVDGDPARFSAEACDALLRPISGDAGAGTLHVWLDARRVTPASLYLRARLCTAGKQWEDAAGYWDEFFRVLPARDPFVLLQFARLLADLGRYADAAGRLRDALALRPPYSFYPRASALVDRVWREAPPALREARIAVVGSSTTTMIVQVLRALCFRDGVNAEFYEGPYGAYRQEILDRNSGLHRFKPTLVFVMTNSRDLRLPPVAEDEEATVGAIVAEHASLWRTLGNTTSCHVVQHEYDLPAEESHDYLATRRGGRTRAVRLINLALGQQAPAFVSLLDTGSVQAEVGRDRWHNPALWCTARQHPGPDALPALAEAQMAHLRAVLGLARKVVVCDLDNTLWGGVIGEDGLSGIGIGPGSPAGEAYTAFQEYLLELKQRGILLAVCSKNDPEDARLPFEQHPDMLLRLEDFVAFVANWADKVQNLRAIAAQLSLGLDSFVFLDDNPVERAWVRSQLPEVLVVELGSTPFTYVGDLDRGRSFQSLTLSQEDRGRVEMYRGAAAREQVRGRARSLDEFLEQLRMRATEATITSANLARVTQLVNKTNQFNLTTRRYTEAEIERLAANPAGWARAFHLADRFGDHGLVGVLFCTAPTQGTWEIDTWLMSCRVLGRRLEDFMFERLRDAALNAGISRIVGVYRPTPKNGQVADLFTRLGFRAAASGPEESRYELTVTSASPSGTFIELATAR